MNEQRIILDLDGVISDFDALACQTFGPCDRSIYSLEKRWPDRGEEIRKFVNNPLAYALLKPIPNARQAISRMAVVHEVIYVTARPCSFVMEEVTRLWLDWYGFPRRELYVVDWGVKAVRIQALLMGKDGFAVDDSPIQIEQLRKLSVPVVIFDQLWNRNLAGTRYLEW